MQDITGVDERTPCESELAKSLTTL